MMKLRAFIISFFVVTCSAMDKKLVNAAYHNNVQVLDSLLNKDNVNNRDELGYCLLAYSIAGSFASHNHDNFKKALAIYKKHDVDLHAAAKLNLNLNCLLFAATLGVKNQNFEPVKIMIQAGADPKKLSHDDYVVYQKCEQSYNDSVV